MAGKAGSRILALLTSFALVLTMVPGFAISSATAGAVEEETVSQSEIAESVQNPSTDDAFESAESADEDVDVAKVSNSDQSDAEEKSASVVVEGLESVLEEKSSKTKSAEKSSVTKKSGKGMELADDPVSSNLADYITSLEIEGNPATVNANENFTIKFSWTLPSNAPKQLTYQLPVKFAIDHAAEGNIRQGENGPVVGSFRVDTSGLVTISYEQSYNPDGQTSVNYMRIAGKAVYDSNGGENKIKFEWTTGSKEIEVVNPGNFSLEKTAERKYKNDRVSNSSVIEYTVEIQSEVGTNGTFTITDALTTNGHFCNGDTIAYDPASFKLVDKNGDSVSISPEIDGMGFTIKDVPALGGAGKYTLTYNVNVEQTDLIESGTAATVTNTVEAESGGKTKKAATTTTYTRILQKDPTTGIDSTDMRLRWSIHVRPNGADVSGTTISDTASSEISFHSDHVTPRFEMFAYDADGTIQPVDYRSLDVLSISADRKTFTLTFPEDSFASVLPADFEASYWRINYYTVIEGQAGDEVTSTNEVTYKSGEKDWTVPSSYTGTIVGRTTVDKKGAGHGEETADGYVPFYWNTTINYGAGVSAYEHTDNILAAQFNAVDGDGNAHWDETTYADDHYGIRSDISQGLKDTLKVTIIDDSNAEQTLTYDEFVAAGGTIKESYFGLDRTTEVAAGDDTTKVKQFKVEFGGKAVSKVEYSYATRFDTAHYATGTSWKMINSVGANLVWSGSIENPYNREVEQNGGIQKQVNLWDENWSDTGRTIDYDKNSDGTERPEDEKGVLTYRILASPAEGETSLHVTDKLPAGMSLISGSVKVGSYDKQKSNSSYEWTNNENVSYSFDEDAGLLSFDIKNLGTDLQLKDENTVVIAYKTKVSEDFVYDSDAAVELSDNGSFVSKTFTNTATNGEVSSSIDMEITRTEEVLSKSGAQVKNGDAYAPVARYSIKINEKALDLLKNSDELTLTDTVYAQSVDPAYSPTSIKLYRMNEDGTKGEEVEPIELNIGQPDENARKEVEETRNGQKVWVETTVTAQSFTMKVQDETAYILEYDVNISKRTSSSARVEGTVYNKAELEGFAIEPVDAWTQGINASAASNHAGLQLVKVDSKNNAKFLEAGFRVDKFDTSSNDWVVDQERITIGGESGFTFDYFANGSTLMGNTLYRIVETDAPKDYKKSETPFYFIIKGNIQDVRSNNTDAANMTIPDDDTAMSAAGVDSAKVDRAAVNTLEPLSSGRFEFANTKIDYDPIPFSFEATKALIGRDLKDGEFSFTVKEGDNVVATGTNDAEGNVDFKSNVVFGLEDVGVHTYTITEDAGSVDGVTYDDKSFEVKVNVSKNPDKGILEATAEYPVGGVKFSNEYKDSSEIRIEGTKAVVDSNGNAVENAKLDGFKFKLEAETEAAPMVSADDAVAVTDLDGKFSFGAIAIDSSMAGKTYAYKISEVETPYAEGTIAMADSIGIEVKVAVSESGDGKLSVEVSGAGVTSNISEDGTVTVNLGTINNTYAPTAEAEVPVTKSLIGARNEMTDGESFQFQLLDEDMNLLDTINVTKDDEDSILGGYVGYFNGEYFSFTREHLGEHYYYVREVIPADATAVTSDGTAVTYGEATAEQRADTELDFTKDGIIYDNSVNRIVVRVSDLTDGDGKVTGNLVAHWEIAPVSTGGGSGRIGTQAVYVPSPTIYFNNLVQAEIQLEATKVMAGRSLEAGKFTFEVKEGDTVVATGINDADGKVTFSKIYYDGISDEGEHTYTVSEVTGSEQGVTYSDAVYTVKVNVGPEVPGDYSSLLTATIVEAPEDTVFTNVYDATGSVKLEGTKTLTGRDLADGEFSFTVKEGETTVATGTNAADGSIAFTEIAYTLDDVGTHVYTVSEDAGGMADITYDSRSFEVSVAVSDNGDGTLEAEAAYPEGGVAFENAYETVDVSVTKVWVGGEGASVTVRLHADGAEADSKTITAADGWTATFSGLPKYSADDGHEIAYTVTEDEVDGYASQIAGSAAEGFTVTNTKKDEKGEDREDPENPDEPDSNDDDDADEPEEDDSDDGTAGSPSGSGKDGGSYVSTGDGSEIAALAAAAAAAAAAAGGIAVVRRRNDSA